MNARLSLSLFALVLVTLAGCAMERGEAASASGESLVTHPSIDVFAGSDGRYYFNVEAANHEVVLQSQAYSSRTAAITGALSVMDNGTSLSRYEMRVASNGEHYFVLDATNGRVIGVSETYATRQSAERGLDTVMNVVDEYLDWQANRVGRRYDVFRGTDGRFYFNVVAGNGEIVLRSQGYSTEAAAYNGAYSVSAHGGDAARYSVNDSADGGAYFNLLASNGQVIGTSEVYASRSNASRAVDSLVALIPTIDIL